MRPAKRLRLNLENRALNLFSEIKEAKEVSYAPNE
jgi:hypothetical protein